MYTCGANTINTDQSRLQRSVLEAGTWHRFIIIRCCREESNQRISVDRTQLMWNSRGIVFVNRMQVSESSPDRESFREMQSRRPDQRAVRSLLSHCTLTVNVSKRKPFIPSPILHQTLFINRPRHLSCNELPIGLSECRQIFVKSTCAARKF